MRPDVVWGRRCRRVCACAQDYVNRILPGAKPGDLPDQFATRFYFVINLKTAKALGIKIPPILIK